EVRAGLHAARALEDGLQHLPRRPGIRRRLEHDDVALLQMRRDAVRRALDVPQVGLALRRKRRRHGDDDRVDVLDDSEIGGRADEPGVDEPLQVVRLDVLDVALAAVDPLDDGRVDVDEDDAPSGVGEGLRVRHADIARSDDGDVRVHAAARLAATRGAAAPSPYSAGRSSGMRASATAAARSSGSSSTRTFAPTSTVSTHSVDGRGVTHGTPYQYASFC